MKEEVTVPRMNSYELGKKILSQNVVKGAQGTSSVNYWSKLVYHLGSVTV